MRRALAVTAVVAAVLAGCGGGGDAQLPASTPAATPTTTTTTVPERAEPAPSAAPTRRTIATNLAVPWGIDFLPSGDALVSERTTGDIVRVPAGGGRPRVATTVPGVDTEAGEGGLLGLAVSPGYADDRLVYVYLTTADDNRIVRLRLGRGDVEPILTGLARGLIHNGGRIAFGPDGKLYAGVGETGVPGLSQDRDSLNGKILRLNPDGSVPRDNPMRGSLVWSLGHRNVQGLAWDGRGRLWATEFGQSSFDEVNLIRPGRNYGWPEVEGRGDTDGGRFTNPVVTWDTSEASPSGAAVAGGALYVAALRGEGVWRIPLEGAGAGTPELLLGGRYGRVRTVVRAPNGALWVATSNRDGRGSPRDGDDRIVQLPVR